MTARLAPLTRTLLLLACLALLAACGSKNYEVSKTIVYKGQIYQVTDTKQITPKIEAVLDDEQRVNLRSKEKNEVSDLIAENKPLFVRMAFQMDEQELVYVATDVDSYRDYNRLVSRFENAGDDIARLMAKNKTEQLKLR